MRVLRWLLVPLLVAAPAQALSMDLDVWDEPLLPGVTVAMGGIVMADCQELTHPVNGDLTGGGMRTAYLEFDAPEGITIKARSEIHFERTACLGDDTAYEQVDIEVTANDILGALEVQRVAYRLTWSDGSVVWENHMVLQMEYLPGFYVRVERPDGKGGPQKQITYEVEIMNHANGASRFLFDILSDDTQGQPLVPDVLILDAAGGERDSSTLHVVYVTPFENGSNQVTENFTLQVTQEFLHDTERRGPTKTVDLSAETEGVYVPGAGPLVLPALLVAAFARRR